MLEIFKRQSVSIIYIDEFPWHRRMNFHNTVICYQLNRKIKNILAKRVAELFSVTIFSWNVHSIS